MTAKKRAKTNQAKSAKITGKTSRTRRAKATNKISPEISAPIFDIKGRTQGKISLPQEVFGQKPNSQLLAQAVRVYWANQSVHSAHTKTRSEVRGGGAKPWRQKGTGRARAGSIRSPLWVGGGVAHGPKARQVRLGLPQKMRRKALIQALSAKLAAGEVKVVANIEKIKPKTKVVANLFKQLDTTPPILLVVSAKNQNIKLASRNIPEVSVEITKDLNVYEVLRNKAIIFSQEAIANLIPVGRVVNEA